MGIAVLTWLIHYPASTRCCPNADSMLGQPFRQWNSIETALGHHILFYGSVKQEHDTETKSEMLQDRTLTLKMIPIYSETIIIRR